MGKRRRWWWWPGWRRQIVAARWSLTETEKRRAQWLHEKGIRDAPYELFGERDD